MIATLSMRWPHDRGVPLQGDQPEMRLALGGSSSGRTRTCNPPV